MNREMLIEMPISKLRALDIKTREDELLVQEILNEKLQNEPGMEFGREVLPSSATDKLTPEKERELQNKLDGIVSPQPEVIPAIVPETKAFCDFCDSKGVRHKKDCTRLSVNEAKI